MNKHIRLAATAAFLTFPCICFASYLVQLTNGTQFVVYQYWEEANQIRFYSRGGAVGIPKDCVRDIRESDIAVENETDKRSSSTLSGTVHTSAKKDGQVRDTSEGKKGGDEIINLEYYKGKKLRLKAELNKALEQFRHSSSNRDPQANKKAVDDITRVSGQILDLTAELREKNKGVLPAWWEGL